MATAMLVNECGIERLVDPAVEEGSHQWDCKEEAQHVGQSGPNLEDLFIGTCEKRTQPLRYRRAKSRQETVLFT